MLNYQLDNCLTSYYENFPTCIGLHLDVTNSPSCFLFSVHLPYSCKQCALSLRLFTNTTVYWYTVINQAGNIGVI